MYLSQEACEEYALPKWGSKSRERCRISENRKSDIGESHGEKSKDNGEEKIQHTATTVCRAYSKTNLEQEEENWGLQMKFSKMNMSRPHTCSEATSTYIRQFGDELVIKAQKQRKQQIYI